MWPIINEHEPNCINCDVHVSFYYLFRKLITIMYSSPASHSKSLRARAPPGSSSTTLSESRPAAAKMAWRQTPSTTTFSSGTSNFAILPTTCFAQTSKRWSRSSAMITSSCRWTSPWTSIRSFPRWSRWSGRAFRAPWCCGLPRWRYSSWPTGILPGTWCLSLRWDDRR